MEDQKPVRKPTRLSTIDYRDPGAYFITTCTQAMKLYFSPVGADSISARMVKKIFSETIARYQSVSSPIFVVMPNHFHAIIVLGARADMSCRRQPPPPTVSDIIRDFKRQTTIEYIKLVKSGLAAPFDGKLWQRSFYDHVIRNQQDFDEIYRYISENPTRWEFDKFYSEA